MLGRSYTGHEHLLEHDIINMNGRIYAPILGQFMQADNYIQTPEEYIGYDRYNYVRGNPFRYTDPSGEVVEIATGEAAGQTPMVGMMDVGSSMGGSWEDLIPEKKDGWEQWKEMGIATAFGVAKDVYDKAGTDSGSGSDNNDNAPNGNTNDATGGNIFSQMNNQDKTETINDKRKPKDAEDILPFVMDPNKCNLGDRVTGRDGETYVYGSDNMFHIVEQTTGQSKRTDDNIAELHPDLQGPVSYFINDVEKELGYQMIVYCGYRSPEQQQIEYNKGSSNAGPWRSWHQYGFAIDIFDKKRLWDVKWSKLAPIGNRHGLRWSGHWNSKKISEQNHFDFNPNPVKYKRPYDLYHDYLNGTIYNLNKK